MLEKLSVHIWLLDVYQVASRVERLAKAVAVLTIA